jgi:UDP-4-keto-D-QuiNAc 4-reductase
VLGATRGAAEPIAGVTLRALGAIGPRTNWVKHLEGIDVAVHLAGSAHRPVSPAAAEREAEAAGALAHAAAAAGVRRLVHVSSIRAMGASTPPGRPFRGDDPPLPGDAYGRAKFEIERVVRTAADDTGLELVILRPPLVYGPGVKGNLRALIRLVASGGPLPFSAVDNRRSLIFLDNLLDLLALVCTHPDAGGRVLLACDGADVSTPELARFLASGLGRRARLFPVPPTLLAAFCTVPALGPALARLTLSLQVDDAETRRILGWWPLVTPESGLAATARAFASRR